MGCTSELTRIGLVRASRTEMRDFGKRSCCGRYRVELPTFFKPVVKPSIPDQQVSAESMNRQKIETS